MLSWFASLVVLPAALASQAEITSAYTELELNNCMRLDKGEELQSAEWRCPGFGRIPLFVQNGDDRYDVDAGSQDLDHFWGDAFDYPGEAVEWRLKGGRPLAIIYRLTSSIDGRPKTSRLIIESVGGRSPGCRIGSVDGQRKQANQAARDLADRFIRGEIGCLQAEAP